MKKIRQLLIDVGVLFGAVVIVFMIWQFFAPKPKQINPTTNQATKTHSVQASRPKTKLRLVAIGDSLTHGVGDETQKGGYVPLVAQQIKKATGHPVATVNYGVTGDKSTQIEKRIEQQSQIQKQLKKADLITLTVGGNDLMAVLQNDFFELNQKQIAAGQKQYQTHLSTLLAVIRQQNPKAPIFILGVYNPFYVYFPEITGMSKAVTVWNQTAQTVANNFTNIYYVNSDRYLTHGDGHYVKQTKSLAKMNSTELQKTLAANEHLNPYISDTDHFHPNQKGYQLLTKSFWSVMQKHQKQWLKGSNS